MTITVIGHLSIDEYRVPNLPGNVGVQDEYVGGIFYSLATLAALMSPTDIIHPVFGVGEKEFDSFKKQLEEFPNIDPSGIFKFKGNTNRVTVFYENESDQRIECSKHIAEPIPFAKIKPFLDTDGILINMISGSDITLDTLDRIRMAVRDSRTPIHFDFHSLTMGIDTEYRRFPRPLTEWRRWCFMLNSIQMTEDEARGLTAERFDETTLVNHLMPLMVKTLLITRGGRGATAIIQNNKKLSRHDFPATSHGPVVDSTGCGDVFGSAFLYYALREKDYMRAADLANQAAGQKSTFRGTEGIRSFSQKSRAGSST